MEFSPENKARFDAVCLLRDCGRRPGTRYDHVKASNHSRLDEIQAALLRVKLPYLALWTERRRLAAARYDAAFAALPLKRPPGDPRGGRHVYHQYVLQTPRRDALAAFLRERGIDSGVYYPMPLHTLEAYRSLGHRAGDFPQAERASAEVLSLPMFSELEDGEISRVCDAVADFFG